MTITKSKTHSGISAKFGIVRFGEISVEFWMKAPKQSELNLAWNLEVFLCSLDIEIETMNVKTVNSVWTGNLLCQSCEFFQIMIFLDFNWLRFRMRTIFGEICLDLSELNYKVDVLFVMHLNGWVKKSVWCQAFSLIGH